jgi:hypothetical protein
MALVGTTFVNTLHDESHGFLPAFLAYLLRNWSDVYFSENFFAQEMKGE